MNPIKKTINNKLLKNFSNAGLYFAGSIIQAIVSLLMQPLYSKAYQLMNLVL
jgi:hypothetical protein